MNHLSQLLKELHLDESGQDLVEYALLGALIALGAVSSLRNVASGVAAVFSSATSTITGSI
jgi:pilus assembly protein Flp/PilA